ncbi:hypothetical protein DBA29_27000 [Xenophilus aerolatus]|nr:hypothetical protein [Xenophilus aerolatus]
MRPPSIVNTNIITLFCDAFDRVEMRLDRHPGNKALACLKALGVTALTKATLSPADVQYQPRWRYELTLLQPSLRALHLVKSLLSDTVAAEVIYVEFARDFPVERKRDARRLLLYFLRTTLLRSYRGKVRMYKHGAYYGRRGRAVRLVVYADRHSKLKTAARGLPCFHAELRLQGAQALRKAGVYGLQDLIGFDFQAIWNERVRHWDLGNRAKLGAAMTPGAGAGKAHAESLQRRVSRALKHEKYRTMRRADDPGVQGLPRHTFALQALVRKHPKTLRAMRGLTTEQWIEKAAVAITRSPRKWR